MYKSTCPIAVAVLLMCQVLSTTAKPPINNWAQPYRQPYQQPYPRVYGDDDDGGFPFATVGLCLISPAVAFRLGVNRGERENEDDGVAAFSVRECALRAFTCGGVTNTDCSNCFQQDTTACTTVADCTASVGFCSYTCP